MSKPQIILEIKTYADGVLVAQNAKIVKPAGLNWVDYIILATAIPCGFWLMVMKGMFR